MSTWQDVVWLHDHLSVMTNKNILGPQSDNIPAVVMPIQMHGELGNQDITEKPRAPSAYLTDAVKVLTLSVGDAA
jgi:hypothetical protein